MNTVNSHQQHCLSKELLGSSFFPSSSDFVTEYIAKCDDKGLEKKKMKEYAGSLSFLPFFLMCEKTKERKENKQTINNNTALL